MVTKHDSQYIKLQAPPRLYSTPSYVGVICLVWFNFKLYSHYSLLCRGRDVKNTAVYRVTYSWVSHNNVSYVHICTYKQTKKENVRRTENVQRKFYYTGHEIQLTFQYQCPLRPGLMLINLYLTLETYFAIWNGNVPETFLSRKKVVEMTQLNQFDTRTLSVSFCMT